MNTKTLIGGISLIVVAILIAFLVSNNYTATKTETTTQKLLSTTSYACLNKGTITASYYDGGTPPISAPGSAPVPTGSVKLTLGDGRTLTLPQTISASGVRYADKNETVVFWNKGNGVTFTEGGKQTFMGCMAVAKNTGNLDQVYGNGNTGMTLRYPTGFVVDENYTYQAFVPTKTISGVKFTILSSMATGTNLSQDSYISVEQIPESPSCAANLFLDIANGGKVVTITEDGMTYSLASTTGAGAGNRYEETVYALPGTNPCLAIRYFIHYGAIENYPKTIHAFDKGKLLLEFDAIRRSLVLLH